MDRAPARTPRANQIQVEPALSPDPQESSQKATTSEGGGSGASAEEPAAHAREPLHGEPSAAVHIDFDDNALSKSLYGELNEHLKIIERRLGVTVTGRGTRVSVSGSAAEVELASKALVQLYDLVRRGYVLRPDAVGRALNVLVEQPNLHIKDIFLDAVYQTNRNRLIAPKGLAQKNYADAIRTHGITFAVGPAGTGKTYLAMACAVASLMNKTYKRIVLTRPAVEAGEKLGFLPGTLFEKVNPYLRPLYDALHDMMDFEAASKLVERGVIEVAPLAFMRGRTLNESFVILDEAQNTTPEQMKMFLTRLGLDAKAIVTGDITQVDLPSGQQSGLVHAMRVLRDVEGIAVCRFSQADVVRHPLVQRIISAYEVAESMEKSPRR
jgi:phosphate starvation-inducible PhoH-like protein